MQLPEREPNHKQSLQSLQKLKVQSEEANKIIHRTITKIIKGPQDGKDKEKFKVQTEHE
jgi:hypothetical protein